MPKLAEIIELLFELAPAELASEGDNVGLQVGDPEAQIDRVLVALDVTAGLIRQARASRAQLLDDQQTMGQTILGAEACGKVRQRLFIEGPAGSHSRGIPVQSAAH